MKLLNILLFLCLLNVVSSISGQSLDWVRTMGGIANTSNDLNDAALDADQNIYITGTAQSSYRPAPGEPLMYPSSAIAGLIQKNDQDGNLLWAKLTQGTGLCRNTTIDLDMQGNIYVGGSFEGTVDFDPGPGIAQEVSVSPDRDGFLLKLNAQGEFLWVKTFRNGFHEPYELAVGPDQNIVLTGYFQGTVDFDPNIGFTNITAAGFSDVFLMKMNSNGNLMWAKGFGTDDPPSFEQGRDIAIDPLNNIYFTGFYKLFIDFDPNTPGSGELIHPHAYETDNFITKFAGDGTFIWTRSPLSEQRGEGIAVDHKGNCYTLLQDATYSNMIYAGSIWRYRSDGSDGRKIHQSSGDGHERYMEMVLSPDEENLFITGTYEKEIDIGNNQLAADWNSENGFVARLDTTGNDLWIRKLGRARLSGWFDNYPYNVMVSDDQNIYLAGRFAEQTDFDPGPTNFNVSPSGGVDIYILKLNCTATYAEWNPIACFAYTGPSGNYEWDSSGVYHDTIPNQYGCDSIITINLTINSVDTAVDRTDSFFIAQEDSARYEWVSCNAPWVVLDSNQIFSPPGSGYYALTVIKNGCFESTDCFAYTAVGLRGLQDDAGFQLYPNPAENHVSFSWSGHASMKVRAQLRDALGRTVRTWQSVTPGYELDVSGIPSGLYWFTVRSADVKQVKKLIIH